MRGGIEQGSQQQSWDYTLSMTEQRLEMGQSEDVGSIIFIFIFIFIFMFNLLDKVSRVSFWDTTEAMLFNLGN